MVSNSISIDSKCRKTGVTIILVLLLFALLGVWKFQEALKSPEMSLAGPGDGIVWHGFIYAVDQETNEKGLSVLFGETFWSEKLGFNLTAPYPLNSYWKWKFWILSRLFSVEKVYEIAAIFAFILIGTFSVLLLREMGLTLFFALIGALLLTHMDHFFSRLNGHMVGIGSYYMPILLSWGAICAGKHPTIWRLVIFSSLNALNFLGCEYYGYFGIFFSSALLFSYFLKDFKKYESPSLKSIAMRFVLSGIIFVFLMCLFYPDLVLQRIYCLLFPCEDIFLPVHNAGHPWRTFLHYSVSNPLALFSTSLPCLRDFGGDVFKNGLGEFTFRIGLVLPVFIVGGLIFYGFKYLVSKSRLDLDPFLECLAWIIPTILIVFFALNPQNFVSLVPLTYKIAPMFRVSARAFLYVDIALIVLFVYLADKVARSAFGNFRSPSLWKRLFSVAVLLFVLFVTAVGMEDVGRGRFKDKAIVYELPDTSIYQCLKGKDRGLVLELPAFSPISDKTEQTYIYFYNRTKHGFPIANIWYPLPSNVEFRHHLHRLSQELNMLSPKTILDLKRTGVRYIVVDKRQISDLLLRESPHVEIIADSSSKSIFEMKVDENFAKESFLEHFVYSAPSVLFESGFGREGRKQGIYWRWAGKRGQIVLKNHSKRNMKIELTTGIYSPVGSTVIIESPLFRQTINMKNSRIAYKREISLKAESTTTITISSNAKPYSGSDPNLVFNIFNYGVRTLE